MSTPRSPPQLTSRDHDDDVIGTHAQWHHSQRSQRQRSNHNTNPINSIQSTIDEIYAQITDKLSLANAKQLLPPHPPPYHTLLPSFISGTLAFYATSFSSQYVQYKLLKMSTGTRPTIIPMTVGVVTVAVGSWMGHLAGLGSTAAVNVANAKTKTITSKIQWNKRSTSSSWIEQCNSLLEQNIIPMKNAACQAIKEMTRPMMTIMTSNTNNYYNNNSNRRIQHERKEAWMHAARICIIGLLTYKTLFRSNFMSLSPSSYTARGSFARRGIPITSSTSSSFNYATKAQRYALDKLGRRFGCHTCGSRLLFTNKHKLLPTNKKIIFHGDHIPPVSVAKQINARWYNRKLGRQVSQKFYPQCTNCSNKQGGLLSRAVSAGHGNLHAVGGGSESYFHGWRMRIGHLTGGLVAAVSTVGVVHDDDAVVEDYDATLLVRSSRDRIRSIQYWIEEWFIDMKRKIWNDN